MRFIGIEKASVVNAFIFDGTPDSAIRIIRALNLSRPNSVTHMMHDVIQVICDDIEILLHTGDWILLPTDSNILKLSSDKFYSMYKEVPVLKNTYIYIKNRKLITGVNVDEYTDAIAKELKGLVEPYDGTVWMSTCDDRFRVEVGTKSFEFRKGHMLFITDEGEIILTCNTLVSTFYDVTYLPVELCK